MEKIEFEKEINAPAEKVWNILLGKDTYPKWTSVFAEGSSVETDWKKGSKAIFGDGTGNGMISRIEENIPFKFLSIKHLGLIENGKEDLNKNWGDVYENYTLIKKDAYTILHIELNINTDWKDFMNETWPKALAIVKEMAEE